MSQPRTPRPEFFQLQNGDKAKLPFSDSEYESRLHKLRQLMEERGVDGVLLTSMHNIAYYSGFLYCSFGRPTPAWSPRSAASQSLPTSMGASPGVVVTVKT